MANVKRGTHRQANGAPSHPAGFIVALTWIADALGISSTVPLVNRVEKLALRPDVIAANAMNLRLVLCIGLHTAFQRIRRFVGGKRDHNSAILTVTTADQRRVN